MSHLTIIILLSYLFATVLFVLHVRQGSSYEKPKGMRQFGGGGVACLVLGAVAQGFSLVQLAMSGQPIFVDLSSALIGLSVSWVVLGVIFIISTRVYTLGLVVAPMAMVVEGVISTLPTYQISLQPELSGGLSTSALVVHALSGYAGYASFFVATLGAAMFILQDRQLRQKKFAVYFEQLPPLERSAKIVSLGVIGGLVLFASAMGSAVMFLIHTIPLEEILADENIHTVGALWCYGAVILAIALRKGWAQIQIAYMALLLGALAMIFRALFAFGAGIHSFSQV